MRLLLVSSILSAGLLVSVAGYAGCGSSAPSKPDGLYLDHGDGTVTDNETGLMWQKCSFGQTYSLAACTGTAGSGTWQDSLSAVQTANGSTFLGHADWRLPNAKELASLADKTCSPAPTVPAINSVVFPATVVGAYWSSSPSSQSSDSVLIVDFTTGALGEEIKEPPVVLVYTRLVRGGY